MTLIPSKEELKKQIIEIFSLYEGELEAGVPSSLTVSNLDKLSDLITKHEVEARCNEIEKALRIYEDSKPKRVSSILNDLKERLSELQKGIEQ